MNVVKTSKESAVGNALLCACDVGMGLCNESGEDDFAPKIRENDLFFTSGKKLEGHCYVYRFV